MSEDMSKDYKDWMMHLGSVPMVALVTTGRTGSDFLQSLLDSHPQISTFNGHFAVYSEFFSKALTFSVENSRVCDAADEFIGHYLYKLVSRYDIQEAKDRLGTNSDESFSIDTWEYKKHIIGLMGDLPLTSRNFLIAVYGAYSLCLKQNILDIRCIFHHPHLDHEFRLFIKDFPKTRMVFTSRDPRANFCSHVEHFRNYYPSHDNQQHLYNCLKMVLEDSELADEYNLDYITTRLEDLPREDVLREFAHWLDIEFNESMLRSTWAGLDWHGDRISNKSFAATGWSEKRTENGWSNRLGKMEQYVLNYIMCARLKHYRYPVKPVNFPDSFFVAILILLPFKFERRFFNPMYVWRTMGSGNTILRLQLLLTPVYYFHRILICYKHYFRTLRNMPFSRYWVGSNLANK